MPGSIKLRGSFELMGGLGIQLNRLSDEQLLVWKPMMRSLVITVYQDSKSHPLKGLAIKQATELGIREKTQEVTPIQQAMMINDMMDQVPGAKNGVNKFSYERIAVDFKSQDWTPKEWHQQRYICSALRVHREFVTPETIFNIMKRMHLMFGKIGLNDSLSKLCDVSRVLDSRPDWIEVFMRVMLVAMKRADWTDCQACTCINLTGRPDRGIMPLPAYALLQHFLARWIVTEFGISSAVSSKTMTI